MHPKTSLPRTAALAALLGGLSWVVDVAVITIIDDSFGVLDDALFLIGLAALVLACGLAAAVAARDARGGRRVAMAAGTFIGLVVVLTLVSLAADALAHALYSGANRGLRKEGGVFAIGLVAAIAGAVLGRGAAPATGRAPRGAATPVQET